jgi:hypothetical protein
MNTQLIEKTAFEDGSSQAEDAVVEILVMLEAAQMTALEAAACARGLTAGALVRCILRDYLSGSNGDWQAPLSRMDTSQTRCP